MNKLSRKLSLNISIVIIIVSIISFSLNRYFIDKYYLHEKKINLEKVSKQIQVMDKKNFEKDIDNLEQNHNVTIVYETDNNNLNDFNENIRYKLNTKKISLNKFWITDEDLNKIKEGKIINQIYNQGKLKSSFLVKFIKKENMIIVIGLAIPHFNETIDIVNKLNLYLTIISLAFIIMLVWVFSKKIIYPLENLKDLSKDIANLNFKKVNIKTNDEIEELAESINIMSERLKEAHYTLEEKNTNLKTFISDISHEVKTPLALIKAYSMGIKDDLDDGSYIDVIINQADEISSLIDNLLKLAKFEKDIVKRDNFNLEIIFFDILKKHKIDLENKNIHVSIKNNLEDKEIYADKEKIEIVLNNLISNAIKYTANKKIKIKLEDIEDVVLFSIKNGINTYSVQDINKIWEPFYVLESSRNKNLSGTGLGLSIVRAILENHNLKYGFNLEEDEIEFYVYFKR